MAKHENFVARSTVRAFRLFPRATATSIRLRSRGGTGRVCLNGRCG
jgi:hypothetical protein